MTDVPKTTDPIADGCPDWADKTLRQILELEVRLGNLRPSAEPWARTRMDEIWKRVYEPGDQSGDEEQVEALFRQVVAKLSDEGFAVPKIVAFVNARLKDSGGLAYCDASEVSEALLNGRNS